MSIDWKSDQGLVLQLIEAQRGLMPAMGAVTAAIEELTFEGAGAEVNQSRLEYALVQIAKAIEWNTDFLTNSHSAAKRILERITEAAQANQVDPDFREVMPTAAPNNGETS
ncbi:MAG: hypothetical protein ABJL57_11955 [Hyphomonas sp.]|jgi:hypothetical protein|uniref:hypothetical protein n=1 Tax=Hyphomonas sp. TaxID=87 RepID=UPI00326400C2